MRKISIGAVLVWVAALLIFAAPAMAATGEEAGKAVKPKYKKVTGEVVSVSPNNIVVKSKAKGALTLAVTNKTDMVGGKAPKAGDRAAVNYRVDKSGKTATRIEILAAGAKAAQTAAPTAAASAAKSQK